LIPVASLELSPDHTAASRARRFVAETLRAWGYESVIPDAELLVSELVTNAVLHARSSARVELVRNGNILRIAVCDNSRALPRVRDYAPDAVTGRGMLLVDRIARRWGIDPNDGGKCVWFEVEPNGASLAITSGEQEMSDTP
jgi:anti-sigma regulatory factor (Ser/Thr protein kinase)